MGMTAGFKRVSEAEFLNIYSNPDSYFSIYGNFQGDGVVDVYKEWHAIHFVLTGQAESDGTILGELMMGGVEIGDDLGYGPARYFDQKRVKELHHSLVHVNFSEKYDSMDRNSEYLPMIYCAFEFNEEEKGYLQSTFEEIRNLFKIASESDDYVLSWII